MARELSAAAPPGAVDPADGIERLSGVAEAARRTNERELAQSRYRNVLLESWIVIGSIEAASGRVDEAKRAFAHAETAAGETRRAREALASVHLQLGETDDALRLMTRVVALD